MKQIRIFISSVQKEFARERGATTYLRRKGTRWGQWGHRRNGNFKCCRQAQCFRTGLKLVQENNVNLSRGYYGRQQRAHKGLKRIIPLIGKL